MSQDTIYAGGVVYHNGDQSWLVYIKATLMGDKPDDVCYYHRSHPFPRETTNDQCFDEAQFDHLAMTASNEAGRSAGE